MLRRALCDVHDGDVTHGLDVALSTLTALPAAQWTTGTKRVAREVLATLPEGKARELPAARELHALTSSA
jgi:hypothetical protein